MHLVSFIKLLGFLMALAGASFSVSICGIGLGIYLSGLLLQPALRRQEPLRPYPFWPLLAALLASLLVSLLISGYFWISLRGLWKYLEGFILLYAGLDVLRGPKELRWAVSILAGAYAVAAAAGVYQALFGVDFFYGRPANVYVDGVSRLTGLFKHCNDYATFLVPAFGLAAALFLAELSDRKVRRSLLWAALFVMVGAVMLRTLSRSGILSAFVSLFIFSLFFRTRWWTTAGLAASMVLLWVVPSHLSERLRGLFDPQSDFSERLLLLRTTWRMVQESPWFGLGLNTYSDYFPKFKPPDYPALMYAHNSYIQMAAESGLLGIGLYVAFIAAFVNWFCRALAAARPSFDRTVGVALVSGIAGVLVNACFESLFQSTQLRTLFWALMGMASALAYNGFFEDGKN